MAEKKQQESFNRPQKRVSGGSDSAGWEHPLDKQVEKSGTNCFASLSQLDYLTQNKLHQCKLTQQNLFTSGSNLLLGLLVLSGFQQSVCDSEMQQHKTMGSVESIMDGNALTATYMNKLLHPKKLRLSNRCYTRLQNKKSITQVFLCKNKCFLKLWKY